MATMKLQFEDNLDYQRAAIDAVVNLFKGQEITRSEFSVTYRNNDDVNLALFEDTQLGIGNRKLLLDEEIEDNLKSIQLKNGLKPVESLASNDFTVEMETGTGKTYVYLRTIFELNKEYGFTKFIIVVPSIAIKEGVYKTLQITQEHFEGLYPKAKGYEYFLYDSNKPGQVRNFATSSNIQIMVTTVGAINKKSINNLYKPSEDFNDEKPIDFIQATHPIIIVDEPQSVDGGLNGKGKEALDKMNPLCTLRYSATHVDKFNMVYRLDAIDAYEKGLVKQIEVASLEIDSGHNKPYIKLDSTQNSRGSITAKVELDVQRGKNIRREVLTVEDGDDLEQITNRAIYANIQIGTITCGKHESIEVKGAGYDRVLTPGENIGGLDPDDQKRLMIRRTIQEHFEKELRFAANGQKIKVLSLFFIDSVEHYRQYDESGNIVKGKYALMFEEEYQKLAKSPKFNSLFNEIDVSTDASEVHNGYFSIDKKGKLVNTVEKASGLEDSERAYNLIMKDKEKLLSFDTKLKFIFSHSALKEGWDNPNVFQICTLRDMGTERERRQTIGRGLRLCVDQSGTRIRGRDYGVNTLTVIATESYEQFAENLQREIEADTGIRFGIVETHQFATIQTVNTAGEVVLLGIEDSEAIWDFLKDSEFIDGKGKIQDSLRKHLKEDTFKLNDEIIESFKTNYGELQSKEIGVGITKLLKKLAGRLDIKNADERTSVTTRKATLDSEEFKALWERIKFKTTYRVDFDNEKLIKDCAEAIFACPPITKTRAQFRKAELEISKGGVLANETSKSGFTTVHETNIELPDILTDLQDRTQLTRKSIVRILKDSKRLEDFKRNPQQFMDYCAEAIIRTKRLALVDGIKYTKVGNEHYYAQELFEQTELSGYLKDMIEAQKSVYTHVIYDSAGVEQNFALDLEKNEKIKIYAKLPSWFKVPTPLGTYNPDWAIVVDDEGEEKLFFVVETKSSTWWDDLRHQEGAKIKCGEQHFAALAADIEKPAQYIKAKDVDGFMAYID